MLFYALPVIEVVETAATVSHYKRDPLIFNLLNAVAGARFLVSHSLSFAISISANGNSD